MEPKRSKAAAKTRVPAWGSLMRWSLALLLFGAMGSGGIWISDRLQDPQSFPLKVVQIKGDFRYLDRKKLEQTMGEQLRGGFFTLDVEQLHAEILEMPWVAGVALRRVWPDTLLIMVQEQVPLARWGKQQLVTARGERFQPAAAEIPAGLPQLEGPEGSEPEMVSRYRTMQSHFDQIGLRIARVQQDLRGAWIVEFTDHSAIRLGNRQIDERLGRFIRLYPRLKMTGQGRPKQVDLRYTNGFVVHWELDGLNEQSAARPIKRNGLG